MMLFGKPTFFLQDFPFIPVSDLDVSAKWFEHTFGTKTRKPKEGEDLGDLDLVDAVAICTFGHEDSFILLGKMKTGAPADCVPGVPMIYTNNIKKAHEALGTRGVAVSQIRDDGTGHRFFDLNDPDGHLLEVCEEN